MLTIKRILCPVDLSADSDQALRYAVALARAYQAELLFCYCPDTFADETERQTLSDRLRQQLNEEIGVLHCADSEHEAVILSGDPGLEIPKLASQRRVDLIVMRSRRRPIAAALLGSTAETVCRTAPCPVLILHPDEREWVGATTCEVDLRRILVAQDFSNDSELALHYALSLAQEYQAELHLLHVLPVTIVPALAALPSVIEEDFQRAARQLRHSVDDEVYLWCQVRHAVKSGQPYREILTYAEENAIDLICMGAHGAGFSMHALFGSNSDRVMRQARCPVLIAQPLKPSVNNPAK